MPVICGFVKQSSGGFGAWFGVLLIIGLVIKFIWWILGATAVVGLFFLARAIARWSAERAAERARYRQGLAARADQQHLWVLLGDGRGIYGVDGAEVMRRMQRLG